MNAACPPRAEFDLCRTYLAARRSQAAAIAQAAGDLAAWIRRMRQRRRGHMAPDALDHRRLRGVGLTRLDIFYSRRR